jgi:hypothetical protein
MLDARFGHSPFGGAVIAFSRILAASEVVVVANTSTAQAFTGHVLVDADLTPPAPCWRSATATGPEPTHPVLR